MHLNPPPKYNVGEEKDPSDTLLQPSTILRATAATISKVNESGIGQTSSASSPSGQEEEGRFLPFPNWQKHYKHVPKHPPSKSFYQQQKQRYLAENNTQGATDSKAAEDTLVDKPLIPREGETPAVLANH